MINNIIDAIHAHFTRYEGIDIGGKYKVIYPDGQHSRGMTFGNAYDYAKIFKGKVVKVNE